MARVAVLETRFPHIFYVTKSNMLREMDSNFNVQNLATLSFTVVDIAYSKLLYILAGPPGSPGAEARKALAAAYAAEGGLVDGGYHISI